MTASKGTKRVCRKGHTYYKSSACPVCPVCEKERNVAEDFLPGLAAPARRALEREGLTTLKQLSKFSEQKLLELHGFGPGSLPKLRAALEAKGLSFKK